MAEACTHTDRIERTELPEEIAGCEDCLAMGGRWLHLRMCATCGHIGCCDSSPNRHATAHVHASGHPIIRSAEPGEDWFWCYEDELAFTVSGPASRSGMSTTERPAGAAGGRRRALGARARSSATCAAATAATTASLRAESGADALDAVRESKLRGATIALLLADQRMPEMSGVEFLEEAMRLAPEAKRVLLTAYADTQAAIDAINRVCARPLPAEAVGPAGGAALPGRRRPARRLAGGRAGRRRPASGSSGTAGRAESHDARDFLARNQVPYRWLDVERDDEGRRLLAAADGEARAAAGAVPRRRRAARPDGRRSWPSAPACAGGPSSSSTTSSSSAAARPAWRRRSTAPPRACARR